MKEEPFNPLINEYLDSMKPKSENTLTVVYDPQLDQNNGYRRIRDHLENAKRNQYFDSNAVEKSEQYQS